MAWTTTVRSYRPGDPPPPDDAKRYKNSNGYVRLRWRIAPQRLVECYEHRWVMQCFDPALQVHHKNGVKDDNRPENLEVVSLADHTRHHNPRRFDLDAARSMYESGMSTPEIGRTLGVDGSNVYRQLRAAGVSMRSIADARRQRRAS